MKFYYEYKEKNGCITCGHNLKIFSIKDDFIILEGIDLVNTIYDYYQYHWSTILNINDLEYLKITPMPHDSIY